MKLFKFLKKKKVDDFEILLQKAATEPAYRSEFIKKLLIEKLVVVTNEANLKEGYIKLQEDTKVRLFTFGDGKVPVFTSTERIFDKGIIKKEVKFLELKGEDLLGMLKGKNLILNPYSDYGKEFTAEEIENILNGTYLTRNSKRLVIEKDTEAKIGQPAKYPTEIVKSLVELFSTTPTVTAAYLGYIHVPLSNDPPHYIFGIETTGNWIDIERDAGFTVSQHLRPDEIVDFVQLTGEGFFDDYFIKNTQPFYKT